MIECVNNSVVRPGVRLRVETFVAEMTGMHFIEEGEVAVEVGVPGNAANSENGRRSQCHARVHDRLCGLLGQFST